MASPSTPFEEGFIAFPYQGETYQTYYKLAGSLKDRTRPPVVVLHGGPGFSNDYMIPLADLVEQSFPVILYDQLGNARSTHLPDKPPTFWTIDLFLDEFENLVKYFGIQDGYVSLGHSWGGMMAAELVVRRQPKGLQRLVIADSPASIALWTQSFKELVAEFPQDVQDGIAVGQKDRERFWKAYLTVAAVHGCRAQPFPKELEYSLLQTFGEGADRTVANASILDGWTIIDRLHQIQVPTLVINGRYDFAQDYVTRPYSDNIPNSKWIKFEDSSHTPHWEERERYMKVVGDFLAGGGSQ
ncbi:proline-specific peptidase [Trametes elegans]|nr:proline-specific peptidase [Trametes elegans]